MMNKIFGKKPSKNNQSADKEGNEEDWNLITGGDADSDEEQTTRQTYIMHQPGGGRTTKPPV